MSPRSKKEYLEEIFPRYKKATSKEQKTKIIDELCEICKYHRKHAIRLLTKFKRFIKPLCGVKNYVAPSPGLRGGAKS